VFELPTRGARVLPRGGVGVTTSCPSCDAPVDVDEVRDLGRCPECDRDVDALLALAAGRTPREERTGFLRG
jgi:hypothetical protein